MALHAHSRGYRFLVLFFNCMLIFGSFFCFDMPSMLQAEFTGTTPCSDTANTTNCCHDCLYMSPAHYNLLYAIFAWTDAVVGVGAGFLIDKVGNTVGALLFSGICVIGSSAFAVGMFFKGTSALLPIMLVGRLILGSGNGSLAIVQDCITSYWFKGKELAMAFGITIAFSRIGSILNFFITQNFEDAYGLAWTLWGGAILCFLSFLSAIVVAVLEHRGSKALIDDGPIEIESNNMHFSDITRFPSQYWVLVLIIMFFYNGIIPFAADASKFIQDKYGYNPRNSAYITGAMFDVSIVISPVIGGLIDIFGKRGYMALTTSLLTIPFFGLLGFTYVHPLVSTLGLGLTYSFAAATVWSPIALIVRQETIGTAMGLAYSIQMTGIGISNLIVGQILGESTESNPTEVTIRRWKFVMLYLLANILCCTACCVLIIIMDKRQGGILNQSRSEKQLNDAVIESCNNQAEDHGGDNVAVINTVQSSETTRLVLSG